MRICRFALVALFAAFGAVVGALPAETSAAIDPVKIPYAVASESYYRVDTEGGRISVSIHAEFMNVQLKDLPTLPIYVMPGAENFAVKENGQDVTATIVPGSEATAVAGIATVTLTSPLKQNLRRVLEATYDIAPRTGGKLMSLEPGIVETPFIGQGPGSFVLVDVPVGGDNYFDPGCLQATDQPKDVKAGGRVRWVCGEVTIIALNGDDPDVLARCAAMDDKCRQRGEIAVFSAYVQSITDLSKAGRLEADVPMPDGRTVHLALKYFKRDQAWADKQWPLAQKAFPRLEAVFGFPYSGDSVTMRQSHHIERVGAAGVALNGEVLLATNTGFDEEVTIHELAHMWASYNLETKWLWEGLAEYGMRAIAGEFGVTPLDTGWQKTGYKDPLATWYHGSSVYDADYWYGKAGAFWFAYEAAVGGRDVMARILGGMDDEPALLPLDAGWFMDQGEFATGKNLDQLFLDWVFNPVTAKSLLETRRAAHDQVRAMQARAATMGLSGMPADIYDNLIAWAFDPVAGQVARGNAVLDSYAQVIQLSTEAGLGTPDGVARSWGKNRLADTAGVVEEQRQAVHAILNAARELADEPEGSPSLLRLADARAKYAAGDYPGAKAAAAGGVTDAYNQVTAGKMIAIARDKEKEFSPNFFARIGMLFTNPAGDLDRAEQLSAEGDGAGALKLARHAYDTWDSATQRGIQRLAILAGLMCGLSFLVWFLLHRLEAPVVVKRPGQGHILEVDGERRGSWRDWENTQ